MSTIPEQPLPQPDLHEEIETLSTQLLCDLLLLANRNPLFKRRQRDVMNLELDSVDDDDGEIAEADIVYFSFEARRYQEPDHPVRYDYVFSKVERVENDIPPPHVIEAIQAEQPDEEDETEEAAKNSYDGITHEQKFTFTIDTEAEVLGFVESHIYSYEDDGEVIYTITSLPDEESERADDDEESNGDLLLISPRSNYPLEKQKCELDVIKDPTLEEVVAEWAVLPEIKRELQLVTDRDQLIFATKTLAQLLRALRVISRHPAE